MKKTAILAVFVVFCVLTVEVGAGEIRTWASASGTFSTEAEYISTSPDGNMVSLRKKDGTVIQVAIDQLSQKDQEYVAKQKPARDIFESATIDDADTTPTAAAKEVFKYLGGEGYSPRFDEDGDVVFKYEGLIHIICFEEKDEEFFKIIVLRFWSLDSPEEAQKAKEVLPKIRSVKVATIVIVNDAAHCEVELFCADAKAFTKVLRRSLLAMRVAIQEFSAAMKEK